MPHIKVDPDELEKFTDKNDNKRIIISNFTAKHLVRPKDDSQSFDKTDYYNNPRKYESKFYEYLPFISFLVNGIYWEAKFPRILTIEELREAVEEKRSRLLGVCDISADFMGSI